MNIKYFLTRLFRLNKYTGDAPEIIKLDKPLKVLGFSTKTNKKTVIKDVATISQLYKGAKDNKQIKHKKEPWAFMVISRYFDKKGNWEYIIGDVVTKEADTLNKEMIYFEVPSMDYAVFKISFSSRMNLRENINEAKYYFHKKWLPASKYRLDDSILTDLERHDARCLDRNKPEIELWFPVISCEK